MWLWLWQTAAISVISLILVSHSCWEWLQSMEKWSPSSTLLRPPTAAGSRTFSIAPQLQLNVLSIHSAPFLHHVHWVWFCSRFLPAKAKWVFFLRGLSGRTKACTSLGSGRKLEYRVSRYVRDPACRSWRHPNHSGITGHLAVASTCQQSGNQAGLKVEWPTEPDCRFLMRLYRMLCRHVSPETVPVKPGDP